ncbi:MAG: metallophosphoesterase [Chloroflexi bacterium]|nr:metallophosphoesterase [Chloroflexota bacterium]
MKRLGFAFAFATILFVVFFISTNTPRLVEPQSSVITFAAIGDYGVNNSSEAAVANMVAGWNPELVITLGDNYYIEALGEGSQEYDMAVGKYYCAFLKDITTAGTFCPVGQASVNRFFPALGDHDYDDAGTTNGLPTTYTDYFNLPGGGYTSSSNNERYYDFVSGPVHFFVLNSYDAVGAEPDGNDSASVQAQWLQTQLAASTSIWNLVVVPDPPYSSGIVHGSTTRMQWPFAQWGADAVLSGNEHLYERILKDGIVYFVNGLGGASTYPFVEPPLYVVGSEFRYNADRGAQRITASDTALTFEFYSIGNGGTLQDTYTLTTPHNTATPAPPTITTGWNNPGEQTTTSGGDGNGFEIDPVGAFSDGDVFAIDVDSGTSATTSCNTDTSGKDTHRYFNYNFSIPTGATIKGIQVRLDAMADSAVGDPKMCVSISPNNGQLYSAWKNTPTLGTSETTYLVGSAINLWGLSWSADSFTNNNFRLRIRNVSSNTESDFSLDWVSVNVSYSNATATPVPPTSTYTLTPSNTPTITLTPTPTSTPTDTPTNTPTPTDTSTPTPTFTFTPTPTYTFTPSPTFTFTSTSTSTSTFTFTPTSTPIDYPIIRNSTRANTNPASARSLNFNLTFSKPVINLDTNDFTLASTGVTGASVSGVSGSGDTYVVTVNTGSGNGTIRLDVPNTATITDLAGNPLSGLPYINGETYDINKTITRHIHCRAGWMDS